MADELLSNPSTSRPGSPVPSLPQTLPPLRSAQPAFRFTWDRKRGPGSVSSFSEVESRADYVGNLNAARGEIQGLNNASVSLDALGPGWSSAKHGFHAISTVLNHPTKRAAPPKAHSTLPTVPPADLPRVRRKDFDPYLKDIGPQWNAFQRALAQSTRERSNFTATIEVDPDGLPTSPISQSTSVASASMTRTRPMPSLDTVPPIFFDPDFNLTKPATFALVTEMNLTTNDPQGLLLEQDPASISYSVPLLERLSHYADTVEGHLVQEIQARSSSFFSALTNLHDLQSESERCLRRIADLKSMLTQIDEKGAKNGLELVREDMKITHLRKLEDGVKLVKDVNEMRTIAKGLAGAGEWSDALNVVENVQALMDHKPPDFPPAGQRLSTVGEEETNSFEVSSILPPVDTTKLPTALQDVSLRSLHAFASLPTELRTLSTQIASTLADEFAAVTRQDLSFRTDNTLLPETAKLEDEQMLQERLSPLVMGLMRTGDGGVKDGLERWREVVIGEVRSAVKRHIEHLTASVEDEETDASMATTKPSWNKPLPDKPLAAKTASLAQALAEMRHEDFLIVIRRIYLSLLSCLKGAKVQGMVILSTIGDQSTRDPISSPRSPSAPSSNSIEASNGTLSTTLQPTIDSVIFAATELAHSRVSKLIVTRAEQHAQLKLFEFYTFYEESWSFALNCEVVCKKMVVTLRGTLGGQSKAFLQAFHADKLTRSAKWVEQEEWKAIEVSPRSQRVVELIISSAVSDPPETVFVKSTVEGEKKIEPSDAVSPSISPDPDAEGITMANGTSNLDGDHAAPQPDATTGVEVVKAKCLVIEDRSFYIVAATLQVLGLVIDYLKVMVNLNGLTMECMSRLVEFLKAFNSRTCQVVLGAGAIRSAGLKNITARHLAFASQSLSIMISLIPYIREAFRRHLDSRQFVLLTEFDKLKRAYQEHQNEIHAKLVNIMGDVLTNYIKSLQEVRWDLPQEIAGPNEYIQGLVKQTVTLYKVLHKFLGSTTTEPIMSEAFAMINHRLGEEYQKIPLPSADAKERMLTDARFLHEKLSELRGVGSLNNMVVTIVQEKAIVPKTELNPNGAANGVKSGGPAPGSSTSTPRPRGSIDLQSQSPRLNTRQNTLGSGINVTSNNLAARPSPFAKRTLANLFGGEVTTNSANSSSISLASASGVSTQEGSSGLTTPQLQGGGLAAVGSSGGVTPEIMDGRGSPITLPSPPRTPGSTAFNSTSKESKATDDRPEENVGPADQGPEPSTELRAAEIEQ